MRSPTRATSTRSRVWNETRHRFEHADICDRARLREVLAAHRPSAIVHLAAETHVDRSIDGPGAFIQTNLVGTFALLEETRRYWSALPNEARRRFRFLNVSTDELGPARFYIYFCHWPCGLVGAVIGR